MNLNNIVISGRVCSGIEVKEKCIKFAIAHNHNKDEASFFDCTIFNKRQMEFAQSTLKKGNLIIIEANLKINTWRDREGIEKKKAELLVNKFHFAESKPKSGNDYEPDGNTINAEDIF